ncbi:LysR family transcriptional regulator [Alkalilimnicola ehrlichii]|uniref:LysR family transcriptional regulator n=1 Tax=Alkalilimnicola ehrlichii TaxID=351052 RepID=A0A3E0WYN2_9GAMM|nr:LysR family transcriptional regulator [Alkalilimnicola ehrlichii]RFA30344.1 LysR family transcriptional regulator [Alkalilimnicola ehrlichii]RFA37918.1 LysR family transcriptional regulator [Alkalilimnicola ehrlichii]
MSTPLRLRQRLLFGKAIAIGPGKAELLQHIADSGSISAAARQMGMSYRRAWLLVDTMNQCFRSPLIETAAGGKGGGGARITELGQRVLAIYRCIEAKTATAVAPELAELESMLAPNPPENPH